METTNNSGVGENELVGQDSIKLIKNTKGYSWEVKVYGEDLVKRVTELETKIKSIYGDE